MKKFFKYLLLFIVALVAISLIFDLNFSSAHLENVRACTMLNDNQCDGDQTFFDANSPQIAVSCDLENAPNDTQVEFTWNYLENGVTRIDAVTLSSGDKIGTVHIQSSLSMPYSGWPGGEYEVVIRILDTNKEPIVKKFYVK